MSDIIFRIKSSTNNSLKRVISISILFYLFFSISPGYVQSIELNPDNKNTIINKTEHTKLGPIEYFTKDTLLDSRESDGMQKPGEQDYRKSSRAQDSNYFRGLRIQIPIEVRLNNDFRLYMQKREFLREIEEGMPWQIALENLNIRPDILTPLPQDIIHRQQMIRDAFYIPGVPNLITSGLSISLQDIGVLFGLIEDVSPVIKFDTDYSEEIEIVIYSVQATVVATVFKGIRQPGSHRFVWNGRDDKGRPMPSGDYIGEVRIGNSRYFRKRIQIP